MIELRIFGCCCYLVDFCFVDVSIWDGSVTYTRIIMYAFAGEGGKRQGLFSVDIGMTAKELCPIREPYARLVPGDRRKSGVPQSRHLL